MAKLESTASTLFDRDTIPLRLTLAGQRYLEYVGIPREDSIAIGDGPNDLQMMDYAGIGIAMGNAREEVKKRADMVTSHIDEDGLYHALDRLGLLN